MSITPIETLQSLQSAVVRELNTRARAIEERRLFYERSATLLLNKPTKITFVQPFDEFGNPVHGTVERIGEQYSISIKPCLSLERERFVLCHEVGHAILRHAKDLTPIEREKGKIGREAVLSGALDKATGLDEKKIYQDEYARIEHEADEIALQLCKMLWQE